MPTTFKPLPPVIAFSLDTSRFYELEPSTQCQRRIDIVRMEIDRIIRFLEKNRSSFTPHECYHLDSLIDKYESERTAEARQELKTFLIYMRRCVHPSPKIHKSVESSPDDIATTSSGSSSDDTATTIIEFKPVALSSMPVQNGITSLSTSQNHLSATQHRLQHGFDRQIIPTVLTDTPTGRPRHCRPLCAARKENLPCSCQQCLRAKRLTTKNSSSSTSSGSVVQNTLKALKSVFGREKKKESQTQ